MFDDPARPRLASARLLHRVIEAAIGAIFGPDAAVSGLVRILQFETEARAFESHDVLHERKGMTANRHPQGASCRLALGLGLRFRCGRGQCRSEEPTSELQALMRNSY